MCKVFNTLHQNTLRSIDQIQKKILLAHAKYSILCTWIPGGPYIQLKKNTSCTCKVFNTLHLNTWGPYIQLWKNTSCTCKVFNTLHLNTWGSIYPNKKNNSCTCKVFNTVHLNTWRSIYPTSKYTSCMCKVFNTLHLNTLGSSIQLKKILLAHAKYSILCT